MKKILMGLGLVAAMLFTSTCLAGDEMEGMTKKEKRAQKEEQMKIEKQQRKAEKERKRQMKKLERAQKKEQDVAKREERKKNAEVRKEQEKMDAEEKKMHSQFEKEHKVKMEKISKAEKEEKRKMREFEKEKIRREKKEKRHLEQMKREEQKHLDSVKEETEQSEKQAQKESARAAQNRLAANWENLRKAEVASEYKDGKYADVYMLPAWPFSSWFFKDKAMFNVTGFYNYAKQCYDRNGAPKDISALDLGYNKIYLKDVLLASKLLGETKVELAHSEATRSFLDNFIYYYGSNPEILFNGKAEKSGLEFDFARHVFRDDITIGVQVPVLYMRNHLYLDMNFPENYSFYHGHSYEENASMVFQEELHRILKSKGINELGGSASGLGDITLFGNVEVTTKFVDKIVAGLKVVLPVAKDTTTSKLWAPALSSNNKCTEFAAFLSFLVNYKQFVNPHLFLQASFFTTSHINRRVPHFVESPNNATVGDPVGNDLMAMGDRVAYTANSFEDWDAIRYFADNPTSVKFEKGPEFHIRLGNVFEKFISRRGFLDIYYDLRAKLEDDYRAGNKLEDYDVKKMQDDTDSVEHRIGLEYSYQFDSRTRMKTTMNYSFAGTNAPKAFDIGLLIGHSF